MTSLPYNPSLITYVIRSVWAHPLSLAATYGISNFYIVKAASLRKFDFFSCAY